MNESQVEVPPKARSRACGCMLAAGIALFILIVVPMGLYVAWARASARKVEARLAALRQSGEPTTLEELDAFYRLPDGTRDVTALWLEAMRPLDGPQYWEATKGIPIVGWELADDELEPPPPGEPWPRLEAAEELLDKYADSLRLMHEAARAGGQARYPVDFTLALGLVVPNGQPFFRGAGLLALEAHVRAHRGDWGAAAKSIEAVHRLAGSLEYEPVVISQTARVALDGRGRGVLEAILPHAEWADEELARLQASLEEIDYGPAIVRAVQGERVIGMEAFRFPRLLENAGYESVVSAPRLGPRDNDLHFYLDVMGKYAAATKLPLGDAFDAASQVESSVSGFLKRAGVLRKLRYPFAGILLIGPERTICASVRGDAQNRAAAAAIACERFRRAEGRLPELLDELVPKFLAEVPADPFDGKPLRYVAEDDGFTVYSVGPNRSDDGGRLDEEDSSQGDLVFPVRRR